MTKFTHIRDPKNPKRVVTLARTIANEDGKDVVHVGFAINYISASRFATTDVYNRKLGNKIALGRLEHSPIRLPLVAGSHPMDVVRGFFGGCSHDMLDACKIPYRIQQIVANTIRQKAALEAECNVGTCGSCACE